MAEIKEKVAAMEPNLDDGASRNGKTATRSATDTAILVAALFLAIEGHYSRLTRSEIARAAGVSPGRVSLLAGSAGMSQLRYMIMEEAVARSVPAVVAQGLADKHPAALAASDELRAAALATL